MRIDLKWDRDPPDLKRGLLMITLPPLATALFFAVMIPFWLVLRGAGNLQFFLAHRRDHMLARLKIFEAQAIQLPMGPIYHFYCFAAPKYRTLGRLYQSLTAWRLAGVSIEFGKPNEEK